MALKSWGFELWDQVERVFLFIGQGLEQLDVFYKIVCDIQKIYISLVKKYKNLSAVPLNKTKLVLETSTYLLSINKMCQTFIEQANVYELQSEELRTTVLTPIKSFMDHSKTIINDQKNELTKFKQRIEKQKTSLDAAWTKYYGAYVIKKRADAAYNRVKDDKTIPRVDIEKLQAIANQKESDLDKVKSDYASYLAQFNKERFTLFFKDMPKICSELEMIDRMRAEVSIEAGLALVNIQERHLGKTGICNTTFSEAIQLIDFKADSKCLVDTYKTTSLVPPEFIFVDLAKYKKDTFHVSDFPGLSQQGGKVEKSDCAKSLFAGPGLKGVEIKNMRLEQIEQRLSDIQSVMPAIEKEIAGLQTLFETYRKNPTMGDKAKLEPQIDVNERKLISLKEMQETVGKHCSGGSGGGGLSSSSANAGNLKSEVSCTSEDNASFDEDEEDDFDGTSANTGGGSAPVGGAGDTTGSRMAKVLYRFDATDAQQMTVDADQTVRVVNYDDGGTGWTLVQHQDNDAVKGYVPTNYISLQ